MIKNQFAANNPDPTTSTASRHPRPAFAMLLVIVSLAVVTVSTAAFLAGQLNAPDASANVGRAVKARAAAETGLDLAIAILESNSVDWRTAHVNGVLLENYDYGQGTIDITIADIEGNPPTAETNDIVLTARGTTEDLVQIVEADITAPPVSAEIQLDLGEFAIFGNTSILIKDATVKRWQYSPDAPLKKRLRIGTNATKQWAMGLEWGTKLYDCSYYALNGASNWLFYDDSGMPNSATRVDLVESNPIPLPKGPTPDTSNYTLHPVNSPIISSGEWPVVESTGISGDLTVTDLANVIMATPGTSLLVNGNLDLLDGGDILISAPVNIVVQGDLNITNCSAIELLDGGSLNLFVNGDIRIVSGVIGLIDDLVFDPDRNPSAGIPFYQDPSRLKVYQLPTSSNQLWVIDFRSYVCAIFYAPKVSIRIRRNSAFFGSIVGDDIIIRGKSTLFYDSALDTGWGYTNPNSFIYTAEGTYDTNVTAAATELGGTAINNIKTYVANVSSKLASKSDWKRIKIRLRRHGMRHHENNGAEN